MSKVSCLKRVESRDLIGREGATSPKMVARNFKFVAVSFVQRRQSFSSFSHRNHVGTPPFSRCASTSVPTVSPRTPRLVAPPQKLRRTQDKRSSLRPTQSSELVAARDKIQHLQAAHAAAQRTVEQLVETTRRHAAEKRKLADHAAQRETEVKRLRLRRTELDLATLERDLTSPATEAERARARAPFMQLLGTLANPGLLESVQQLKAMSQSLPAASHAAANPSLVADAFPVDVVAHIMSLTRTTKEDENVVLDFAEAALKSRTRLNALEALAHARDARYVSPIVANARVASYAVTHSRTAVMLDASVSSGCSTDKVRGLLNNTASGQIKIPSEWLADDVVVIFDNNQVVPRTYRNERLNEVHAHGRPDEAVCTVVCNVALARVVGSRLQFASSLAPCVADLMRPLDDAEKSRLAALDAEHERTFDAEVMMFDLTRMPFLLTLCLLRNYSLAATCRCSGRQTRPTGAVTYLRRRARPATSCCARLAAVRCTHVKKCPGCETRLPTKAERAAAATEAAVAAAALANKENQKRPKVHGPLHSVRAQAEQTRTSPAVAAVAAVAALAAASPVACVLHIIDCVVAAHAHARCRARRSQALDHARDPFGHSHTKVKSGAVLARTAH